MKDVGTDFSTKLFKIGVKLEEPFVQLKADYNPATDDSESAYSDSSSTIIPSILIKSTELP